MDFDIVDNLESTDSDSALSANQGRILRNMISNLVTGSLDKDGNIIITFNDNIF